MSIYSCCQKAFIRCHPVESTEKKGVMTQMESVSHGKADGQDGEKERVTLRWAFKARCIGVKSFVVRCQCRLK
jgi:hypothetical protein